MRGIIVFVKNPELGKVKTRLAATLGNEKALEIYNKLVDLTRKILLEVEDTNKYVFYSSFVDDKDDWSNDIFEKRLQVSGGLGDRVTEAVQRIFETCDQVVIIGSDCPQLTSIGIKEAFNKLHTNNVVIGPSHDGGYYLLGMDEYYPELFQGITWSTDTVCEETLNKAEELNLKTIKLRVLSDVDYEEDWVKYGF